MDKITVINDQYGYYYPYTNEKKVKSAVLRFQMTYMKITILKDI